MKKNEGLVFPATILIVTGILFLLNSFTLNAGMGRMWPTFIFAVGIAFFMLYAQVKQYGLLMPASLLTIISLLFYYCAFFGWDSMRFLWPTFLVAVAVGLFSLYWFGPREKGILIPVTILGGLALIFYLVSANAGRWWPIGLIVLGILLFFVQGGKNEKKIIPVKKR